MFGVKFKTHPRVNKEVKNMRKINRQTFIVEIHEIRNGRCIIKYISDETVVEPIYTTNTNYIKRYESAEELHAHMRKIGVDCYNVIEK